MAGPWLSLEPLVMRPQGSRHEVTVSPGKVNTSQSSPQTVHVLQLRVSLSPQPETESQQRPGHGAPAVDLPPSAFLRLASSLCLHCPQSPPGQGAGLPCSSRRLRGHCPAHTPWICSQHQLYPGR